MAKKASLLCVLLLAMVPAANAALYWYQGGGADNTVTLGLNSSVTVQIYSDAAEYYNRYIGGTVDGTIATITAVSAYTTNAGDDSVATDVRGTYGDAWWGIQAIDNSAPFNTAVGNHWDVTITSYSKTGSISLDSDYYSDGGSNDVMAVTVVPEPATMLLLGLGGLFLRRRK